VASRSGLAGHHSRRDYVGVCSGQHGTECPGLTDGRERNERMSKVMGSSVIMTLVAVAHFLVGTCSMAQGSTVSGWVRCTWVCLWQLSSQVMYFT
jgi:hypothetical protein